MNSTPCRRIASAPIAPVLLASLALLVASAPAALAQSGWNRSVRAVAVTPTPGAPGLADVTAVVAIHLDDSFSFPLDLSTEVALAINGTIVATHQIPVGTDPGVSPCADGSSCGGSCGSGHVDGMSMSLLCVPDGPCNPLCDCHCSFPSIESNFPNTPVEPGDEIMVLLNPGPGALPDPDTSDDTRIVTIGDAPVFWDRAITDLTLEPSAAGPGLWDVSVEGLVEFHDLAPFADPASGQVYLAFEVGLVVNGVEVASEMLPFAPVPAANGACGCGETCGSYNGFPLACVLGYAGYCNCNWGWLTSMPAVPLVTGDEIMVILRPAPGALPELPGFDEDDTRRADCCPGATGIDDSIAFPNVGVRLEQNRPNPFGRSTTIEFAGPTDRPVKLEVFDVRGRRVRTLVDGRLHGSGATRQATWAGRTDAGDDVPSGIYFVRLTADGRTETRKMTLTR